MLLYIIRHGEPNYQTDSLTPIGRVQAEAVGERLARLKMDQVFSSPMGRAQETAAPLCRLLGLPCEIEPWAHEIGDELLTCWPDGQPKSVSRLPRTVFRAENAHLLPYDRAAESEGLRHTRMNEALSFLEEQGHQFLSRLGYQYENGVYRILRPNEKKVALFCHAAFSRAWISILLRIPLNVMWAGLDYDLTGVTALEFTNEPDGRTVPLCRYYNDTSHLQSKRF